MNKLTNEGLFQHNNNVFENGCTVKGTVTKQIDLMNLFLYFAYDPGNVEKQKFLGKSKPH